MATISKKIADEIIAGDGVYPGDPQCFAVFEYTNDWGKTAYSVCYDDAAAQALVTSPYVHSPKILWCIVPMAIIEFEVSNAKIN